MTRRNFEKSIDVGTSSHDQPANNPNDENPPSSEGRAMKSKGGADRGEHARAIAHDAAVVNHEDATESLSYHQ